MSWIEDQNSKHKFARDYSVFLGSFSNPEAAKQINKRDDPDYALDDEEFEKSWERVIADRDKVLNKDVNKVENEGKLRHRRRVSKKVIK